MNFVIENVTDIPATILFKEHGDLEFNFETFKDMKEVNLSAEQIYFNPTFYELAPREKKEVTVQLLCGDSEVIDKLYKIDIVNGSPVMFHIHAII